MSKLKTTFFPFLLFLSIVSLSIGCWRLYNIPPADAYVDAGVRDFIPYRVYATQVKNTSSSSRERRMHPTKRVYQLSYLATDGSGYQWSTKVAAESIGEKIIQEGKVESRRILKLPEEKKFVPVAPEETAQSYTATLRKHATLWIAPAAVYIVLYLLVTLVLFFRKRT